MADYIITVEEVKTKYGFRFPDGSLAYSLKSERPEFDEGTDEVLEFGPVTTLLVDKRNLAHVVDEFSKQWPGKNVSVYELKDIAFRIPGVLQRKEISNLGVLPT